jgi:ABC-type transport system involved in multi-copper enzyme maturation permease subunit
MFAAIAFFSAIVGEINANVSECVYVLSKSIKRSVFLVCKILSAMTITLVVAIFYFMILFITWFLLKVNHNPTIFRAGTTA